MPKNTRIEKALELKKLVEEGPSHGFVEFGVRLNTFGLTKEQRKEIQDYFHEGFKLWSRTWVQPLVNELVPELKKVK